MRTLRGIKAHPYAPAYGAEIATEQKGEGVASPLRPADDESLTWARDFWPERGHDEFEWEGLGGRKVRDKATGEILKIRTGWPVTGELESDIACFCIRDSRLVLLGRPGSERPRTVVHGFYYGREIKHTGQPPAEGQAIW